MDIQDISLESETNSEKAKLGSTNYGIGVFATRIIHPGETIFCFEAKFSYEPNRFTIQVDDNLHLVTTNNLGAFVNHNCQPNAYFHAQTLQLKALNMIYVGEEITFNYLSTEWEMKCPFTCSCGANSCSGEISGYRFLSELGQLSIANIVLPYLKIKGASLPTLS